MEQRRKCKAGRSVQSKNEEGIEDMEFGDD